MLKIIEDCTEFVEFWAYMEYSKCKEFTKFGVTEEKVKEIEDKLYNFDALVYEDNTSVDKLKDIYLFFDKVICVWRINRCFTKLNTIGMIIYLVFCCLYSVASVLCILISKSPDIINIINIIMFFALFFFYGFHSLSNFINSYYGVGTVPKMAIYRQMFFAEFVLTSICMSSTVIYFMKIFSGCCS